MILTDAPKFQSNQTIFYSWEGNAVNISCDAMSNPPATILWRRERYTISSEPTANTRVHSGPGRSQLEVRGQPPPAGHNTAIIKIPVIAKFSSILLIHIAPLKIHIVSKSYTEPKA